MKRVKKVRQFPLLIQPWLLEEIRRRARKHERTIAAEIRAMLKEYLAKEGVTISHDTEHEEE